ncbi:MAG: bifunctional phosphopantothenoylcysteine decarboxylase/phosphopantothenate--cysteine ligase CoaBC [Nitrospinae bacterium]|jgi:phosphopantothenoylcysteine decarboxylase / phosphopantothenate---cysteine ligase|nr:bifunctional phosphopantothenoylcysteine decarboxylase/phosphopantothenate--cysteine ligase CoaBC [Nitrospinota bacterium]MDA1108627.1 bifunctional phosphopantothenoylcysteine decarboxylase/phosphopantothenate--cysteine ligase CoaBC [Nitrospinota bacterium]
MSSSLQGKKIVLGVSGGIAAYKAVELLRLMVREKAEVFVVMSAHAGKFVTPLTFEALSGNPVYYEVFGTENSASMPHIRAAENADLLLVAPATAGTLGKLACGLADDALSNLYLAYRGPVIIAPAMNDGMYANPAVQENIEKMKQRGVEFIEPEEGELACGTVGQGRLADPARILTAVQNRLRVREDLKGLKILVTAGPTHEPLDPVRYISNPSSGKMGYAVAEQARLRGAEVTLISGPTKLNPPHGVKVIPCKQAREMNALVQQHLPDCDVLFMIAAVGDFSAEKVQKEKIKKNGEPLILKLVPNPDILQEVAKIKTRQFIVGFAAESENVVQSAQEKLEKKQLDLIVANDISAPGIGFQSDSNQVTLIDKDGAIDSLPRLSKREIAGVLLDRVKGKMRSKG